MLRNANLANTEFSKNPFSITPLGVIKDNVWGNQQKPRLSTGDALEGRSALPVAEKKRLLKGPLRPFIKKVKLPESEDMPLLDSGPVSIQEAIPNSPEMPTLFPFVFEQLDATKDESDFRPLFNGSDRHFGSNAEVSGPAIRSYLKSRKQSVCDKKLQGKHLQPVVVLRRLADCEAPNYNPDYNSDYNPDFNPDYNLDTNLYDDKENSANSWVQWPEEYEGCSYDDFMDPGQVVEKLPEVDVIDGVEFLSFLQEGDVKDYAQKTPQNIIFPSEGSSPDDFDPSTEDHELKDEHGFIFPTKTRDITQIKGWKRKLFLDDKYGSTPTNSVSPAYPDEDHGGSLISRRPDVDDGKLEKMVDHNNLLTSTDPPAEENLLLLGEQPIAKEIAKNAAFASSNLDDFLNKHAQLDVSYLSQYNPTVSFIPYNHPVLKVGTLKVEDKEPSRKMARTVAQVYSRYRKKIKPEEKLEAAGPKFSHSPRYNPGLKRKINPSSIKVEKACTEVSSESAIVIEETLPKKEGKKHTIVFMDDNSNSLFGVVSYASKVDDDRLLYDSQDINKDFFSDNSLSYDREFNFSGKIVKDDDNYAIEEYEPMTYDDETLLSSINEPFRIIQETIWSTKDTPREERMLHDLLCKLKSPDSYLISKIKFDDDSPSDENEPLNLEDAQEVANCIYGGFANVQELVENEKKNQDLEKSFQRLKRKRARNRALKQELRQGTGLNESKKAAYVKAVQDFAEWRRTQCKNNDKTEIVKPRRRRRTDLDLLCETKCKSIGKRSIRTPARFLDSETASDDWLSVKSNQDTRVGGHLLPVSPAYPLGSEAALPPSPMPSRHSTPDPRRRSPSPDSSSAFSGFASVFSSRDSLNPSGPPTPLLTPRATPSRSPTTPPQVPDASDSKNLGKSDLLSKLKRDNTINNRHSDSYTYCIDVSTEENDTVSIESIDTQKSVSSKSRLKRLPAGKNTERINENPMVGHNYSIGIVSGNNSSTEKSLKPNGESKKIDNNSHGVSKCLNVNDDNISRALNSGSSREPSTMGIHSEPSLISRELPSNPMVLNITAPPLPKTGAPLKVYGKPTQASNNGVTKSHVWIELGSGVHTITPKNSKKIQQIKMNLNSTVSIDQRAKMAIQRQPPVELVPNKRLIPLIHLIPLNEYQWKPPNNEMSTSPTIKSYIINTARRDRLALQKDGAVNMPLAAVAQPIGNPATEEIYLLYGTIPMFPSLGLTTVPGHELNSRASSSGLVIRIGKQEFFLSCSVQLAKAPVRLNAMIVKTMRPLLLYPVIKSAPQTLQEEGLSDANRVPNSTSDKSPTYATEPKNTSITPERTVYRKHFPIGAQLPQTNSITDNSAAKSHNFRISWKDDALTIEGEEGEVKNVREPFSFPKSIIPKPHPPYNSDTKPSAISKPLTFLKVPSSGTSPVQFRLALPTKQAPSANLTDVQNTFAFRNVVKESNAMSSLTLERALSTFMPDRAKTEQAADNATSVLRIARKTGHLPQSEVLLPNFLTGDKEYELHIANDCSTEIQTVENVMTLLSDDGLIHYPSSTPLTRCDQSELPSNSTEGLDQRSAGVDILPNVPEVSQETVCETDVTSSDLRVADSEDAELAITDVRSCSTDLFPSEVPVHTRAGIRQHVTTTRPVVAKATPETPRPFVTRISAASRTQPLPPSTPAASLPSSPEVLCDRKQKRSEKNPFVIDLDSDEGDANSLWISGEGETCYVMRLPDEDEEILSDAPTVVTCT